MRTLVSTFNYLIDIRSSNPLNTRSEEFLFTMRQVVYIYELTGGATFYYNVLNTSVLPGISLLAMYPDIFDVAKFSSPEFTILFENLHDIFAQYRNSSGLDLQIGFYTMNQEIGRFITNTHANLFSDHPLLNVERRPPNRFLVFFGNVVIRVFNFFL